MSRFLVIRESSEQDERVIEEAAMPTEAEPHQVLMRHLELVPATDLGLGGLSQWDSRPASPRAAPT
jgi:hypothetical protein